MLLKYFGGDADFLTTPFNETGAFTSFGNRKMIYSTLSTETVFGGTGFKEGQAGLPDLTTGLVKTLTFNQGGTKIGKFSSLNAPVSVILPALLAVDAGDFTEINALLSSSSMTINALKATDGYSMTAQVVLDGGLKFLGSKFDDAASGGLSDDKLIGGKGNDDLSGGGGKDKMNGGAGDDTLDGGSGIDNLNGGGGDDTITGGGSKDKIKGGGGNDSISGDEGNDVIKAGAADDMVFGGTGDDEIDGDGGDDALYGGADNDVIRGGDGNDTVDGGDGNDILGGGGGKDDIFGGAGNDFIIGGALQDDLYGGTEADQFIYVAASDSGKGSSADVIHDFELGIDFMDLSMLGVTFTAGAFSGTEGEYQITDDGVDTRILVDADGDGLLDMRIDVLGVVGMDTGSFV